MVSYVIKQEHLCLLLSLCLTATMNTYAAQWQTKDQIKKALESKSIAIVGLSSNTLRDSNLVGSYLLANGYKITPVNPNEDEVFGIKSFRTLLDIPYPIELVNVFRDSSVIPDIAKEAVSIGANYLWLQYGLSSPIGVAIAENGNMTCIVDKCLKVEHEIQKLTK